MPPFIPEHTIKDLMLNIVDTNADVVWLSVTTVASDKGLIETRPKNDAEWARVRQGAVTLAEAANLLMIPGRHVARPGEKSVTPGVELEPSEMEELINKDRESFYRHAKALYDAAMLAVDAIDKKDADRVFEVGENIDQACEQCHRSYWYPNEKIPELPVAK
jgi:cytochrome c556